MGRPLERYLVVSDMDGTLLNDEKELLSCNLESIRLFTQLGGHFAIATGRTVESVRRYSQLLPMLGPVITCNGAIIYDFSQERILLGNTLPRMASRRALFDIVKAVPGLNVVVTGLDLRNYQAVGGPFSQRLYDEEQLTNFVRPASDLPSDWAKVLFCGTPELIEKAGLFLETRQYPGISFVTSAKIYMEMTPEGVSKGSALRYLCGKLDIPLENCTVIGDYHNDLEMMQEAGWAVAMKNAPAEVRMAANEVCGCNNDGGVGQMIYELIRRHG